MMTENKQRARHAVLVFLRAPEKGQVKTRLAKTLGDEKALALYKCFVEDTLQTLQETVYQPTLCYHPSDKLPLITQWLGENNDYWPQEGISLGDKMANGFIKAFKEGFDRVVVLGTDVPDLSYHIINTAIDALKTHPAVIGPSKDGGYYLIGFQAHGFLQAVFKNMPWGTDLVFSNTLSVFRANQEAVFLLPTWQDIDDIEDLEAYFKRHSDDNKESLTMELLSQFTIF
jgi:uncharacterized protein